MTQTVREFITDSYKIISSNSPTTPLHGNDMQKGIQILNELLQAYSSSGLLLTVSDEITYNVLPGQSVVTFGSIGQDVNEGRLANTSAVWLVLQGVTYPLVDMTDNSFFNSYKYQPLLGLPLYYILQSLTNSSKLILYPGASQAYELHVYGKFEKQVLTSNDTMAGFPLYFIRFLHLAVARDLAIYKSRMQAWTSDLENRYVLALRDMESASQVNLEVNSPDENMLNGAYRVRAGI